MGSREERGQEKEGCAERPQEVPGKRREEGRDEKERKKEELIDIDGRK